jgi:hypothetical protein
MTARLLSFRPSLETLEDRSVPALYATGADAGFQPRVLVLNPDGTIRFNFNAYAASYRGGVRVAVGDVSGDGTDDILAAVGRGRPRVRIFSGVDSTQITEFRPFPATFRGGVFVGAGNFDSDTALEIVTGSGAGDPGRARVWNLDGATISQFPGPLRNFAPFGGAFRGGVTVAAGNIDGADLDEVIVGVFSGGVSRVRAFRVDLALAANFLAFGASFRGGVFVTAGDLRGDVSEEIIVGPNRGRPPEVRIFSVGAGSPGPATRIDNFFAYQTTYRGGARVALVDRNNDSLLDIVTGPGTRRTPLVRVFDGVTLGQIDAFFPYPQTFRGGVFVGGA